MSTKQAESWVPGLAPKPRIGNPTSADYQQWGNELINKFLAAGALTAGGGALYHLVHGFNSSQVPELLRNKTSPLAIDETDVAGAKKPSRPRKKKANFAELLGKSIPQGVAPEMSAPGGTPAHPSINSFHESWRQLYNIAAAGLGGAAGLGLVGYMAKKKRKSDLSDEIESARKEYFDALTGKSAAADELDRLYVRCKQAEGWLPDFGALASGAQDTAKSVGDTTYRFGQEATTAAHLTALLAGLGSAGVGGLYMYNRTKERSRAKNLQRAAASRARLREIYQTPWVDPAALESVAGGR